MRYISTRGRAPELAFSDVLLAGLASDGGLYVPAEWPRLPLHLPSGSYQELAVTVMSPFVGQEIDASTFRRLVDEAYSTFRHPAITPLRQLGPDEWLLDLAQGPTRSRTWHCSSWGGCSTTCSGCATSG
jgi:threonine synthase